MTSDSTPPAHIHLIGICGTAMASLAAMLRTRGYRITGSDTNVYPPMSEFLDRLEIAYRQGYAAANLDPRPDLVVIGNALSRGNPEVEHVLDEKIPYRSLPELLKEYFLRGKYSIVVAGTHGKTTTASLLAWILEVAGLRPSFLVGGIAENFGSSFQLGAGEHFVIEGDEYDSAFFDKGPKFLHYLPDTAILTSVEFDHADIYADLEAVKTAFRRLVNLLPRRGYLAAWGESEMVGEVCARAFCPVETYGLSGSADWQAHEIFAGAETTRFTAVHHGQTSARIETTLAGEHNVLNILATVAMAARLGVAPAAIEKAIATFRSVRRRLEVKGEAAGVLVVDDFAHHPTAIARTLAAARQRFPGRRLWAVVEPRSNTMRRCMIENDLVRSFAAADQVILAPVFRPEAIAEAERLDPGRVAEAIRRRGKPARAAASADAILETLLAEVAAGDLVLFMSNGGFSNLPVRLLEGLRVSAGRNRQ